MEKKVTARMVSRELKKHASKKKAALLQRFFKTGKGEYGEGDIFIGVMVPETRSVARTFKDLEKREVQKLLKSKIHEERFAALAILVHQFQEGDSKEKRGIYNFYLKNTKYINNWDLVDVSAPKIVGEFLVQGSRNKLYALAKSKDLWEKRISIVATFAFIDRGEFKDTLKISEMLLGDSHDLIHKAVGWALREVGKKDIRVLERFLEVWGGTMPRTALRYSIEKFSLKKRKYYMNLGG